MSEFDAAAAELFKGKIIALIVVVAVLAFLLKNFKSIYQRYFVWAFLQFQSSYKDAQLRQKEALFAPLANFKSLDWNLRNQGLVRILEIGIGTGSNFRFYPKNARVVAVDPNPHFKRYLDENRRKFRHIKFERLVNGAAETHLAQIEDNSVDVVVTTSVLCSVNDLDKVLREIRRVLAPGGVYFFLEHVAWPKDDNSTIGWHRLAQRMVNIVWPLIFDGCRTTLNLEPAIQALNFDDIRFKRFVVTKYPKLFQIFIGPHVYGTAQKKRNST